MALVRLTNSYLDVGEADILLADDIRGIWIMLPVQTKERALVSSSRFISPLLTQECQLPLQGGTVVNQNLQLAVAEFALALVRNPSLVTGQSSSSDVSRLRAGSAEVELRSTVSTGTFEEILSPVVMRYLNASGCLERSLSGASIGKPEAFQSEADPLFPTDRDFDLHDGYY